MNIGEWAAWVQAIGSILAILASGALAIWVPIHMRQLDEKARVQRALNSAIFLMGMTVTSWASLWKVVEDREFNSTTPETIGEAIAISREAARQIPHGMLLGTAVGCLTNCLSSLQTLQAAMNVMAKAPDPYDVASAVPFKDKLDELEAAGRLLEKMKPMRADGLWMIWSPEDDLPSGTKLRG